MSTPAAEIASPMMLMLIASAALMLVVAASILWARRAARREVAAPRRDELSALVAEERGQRLTAMMGPALTSAEARTVPAAWNTNTSAPVAPALRRPGFTARWKGTHRLVA